MLNSKRWIYLGVAFLLLASGMTVFAQWEQRGRRNRFGGGSRGGFYDPTDRGGVPRWENEKGFDNDVFTFARVRYTSYGRGPGWATDYPTSDLNFSLRLQQLTSMKVSPDPAVVDLESLELFNYPFIYMIEPGSLWLSDGEVAALRRYCLNGGFMMVDDFWGMEEYEVFENQIKRVFPDRPIQDVPLEHEIFHCVYDLKEKPQVPARNTAEWGRDRGITWEERWDSDTSVPYYKAIMDDDDRIMVFICHNTDLGDGWEREAESEWYFQEFSVKKSYPMGINIVVYAMTH